MKLRIKGDSLRLRISPSEMSRLLQSGRVEDTIHFGPQQDAKLTYALQTNRNNSAPDDTMTLRYQPQEVVILVPVAQAAAWADGTQVGMYAEVDTGAGQLDLAIEKDFACLDKDDADNQDTFPNPNQGAAC